MMKSLFWLVGLFAAAVALALLMGQNGATVTLFWVPYRVDMSFNLVLAGVLLVFFLVYVALRSLAVLSALPAQALKWRLQQRERVVNAALLDALSNQLAGRFVRARRAAKQAIEYLETPLLTAGEPFPRQLQMQTMAHLLAAESSHALQDQSARNLHLDLALKPTPHSETAALCEGAVLRAIRWAVEDRNLDAASHWLSQLPQGAARRTLALRLKLKVARLGQDHAMALETARLLAKHNAFSEVASRSILRGLQLSSIQNSHDADQVRTMWQGMDSTDRQDPELVLAALTRLQNVVQDTGDEDTRELQQAQAWVLPIWEQYAELTTTQRRRLVMALQAFLPVLDASWLVRIESMQRSYPADPMLQYLAAQTFFHEKLWGKAQQFFQQASLGALDDSMQANTWIRLAQLAERRGDQAAALAAWREAALPSPKSHRP
jgi:HemY protein